MTTYFRDNTYKTAEVSSANATHHTATIKDDYGNVKEIIHYQNVNKEQVLKKLKEQNFTQENKLF